MHSSILLTLSLVLPSALALPGWGPWGHSGHKGPCLNDAAVNTLLTGYTYLLEFPTGADFNTTANAILSDKFFVSSDSIDTLAGIPVCFLLYRST